MAVVCGSDFSERCNETATLSATIARRLDQPLELVHSLDTRGVLFNVGAVLASIEGAARQRLEAETARLRALGATVNPTLSEGWPDEAVLDVVKRRGADLVVLSAHGHRAPDRATVGKTCERVALGSDAPVLVVRQAEPLRQWLAGERVLKVMCALDFGELSQGAVGWARRLSAVGPCELMAAYVDDPAREASRLGLRTGAGANEVQQVIENELRDRLHRVFGADTVRLIVSPHLGDAAAGLSQLADREGADVLLVGTHQRRAGQRALHGSVSMDLIRHAQINVLAVPSGAMATVQPVPAARRVLIATDLSPLGNRAVLHGLALLSAGARVRLLTVVHPMQMPKAPFGRAIKDPAMQAEFEVWREECRKELLAVVPADCAARGISVEVEVVEHGDASAAIREAAERIDADLVCMGTAGRTGLAAALLGSVAQGVLRHSRRPVLLVPPGQP